MQPAKMQLAGRVGRQGCALGARMRTFYHTDLTRSQSSTAHSLLSVYGIRESSSAPDKLTFDDPSKVYGGCTTEQLVNAWLVLRMCGNKAVVKNSEALLERSKQLLGPEKTYQLIENTLYKHYCAGETAADVWSRMNSFRAAGVGAILDWAEEEDMLAFAKPRPAGFRKPLHCGSSSGSSVSSHASVSDAGDGVHASPAAAQHAGGKEAFAAAGSAVSVAAGVSSVHPLGGESIISSGLTTRMYSHASEDDCDKHLAAYINAIDTAATLPGQGFAAIKLTALTEPLLLERLSAAITRVQQLFERFDADHDGYITRQEFDENYSLLLGAHTSFGVRDEMSQYLDKEEKGQVDYVSWMSRMDVRSMPRLAQVAGSKIDKLHGGLPAGPYSSAAPAGLAEQALSREELGLLERMHARLQALTLRAAAKGVKLMIDAEHTLFNPAIDHIAASLMREHNKAGEALVLSSYQAYLHSTVARLACDLERAHMGGYVLGAKLVRGAYYHLERKHALTHNEQPAVFDHLHETTHSFNSAMDMILRAVKLGHAELMLGSHNHSSVERCTNSMRELGLDHEEAPVFFGQLMGMSDHLSYTLGHHGYRVYKYVPYGRVEKCVPYLLRRMNETQYAARAGRHELAMISEELTRRAAVAAQGAEDGQAEQEPAVA